MLRAALLRRALLVAERLRAFHLPSSFPSVLDHSGWGNLHALKGHGLRIAIP